MRTPVSKLKFSLASDALIHFFSNQYWSAGEVKFIRNFCFFNDSDNIRKLKLRLLCEENNDMIVAAVLADATPEEQIFLYDRYYRHFSFVKIGMKLHIHPNGLQRWRDKFLADIASLLEYKLPPTDIFSRNKIEALIFVLERTVVFHKTYGNFDQKFLTALKIRLNVYQNLLFTLKQFLNSSSENICVKIIRTKILNLNKSIEELEKLVGTSHTTLIKYFHLSFQNFCGKINYH